MTATRPLLVAAVAAACLFEAAFGATGAVTVDGHGGEWTLVDRIGSGTLAPSDANATVDLLNLFSADNATHWFFAVKVAWMGASRNASIALYLAAAQPNASASADPGGNEVMFPANTTLLYAVYVDVTPAIAASSHIAFFDGSTWKNRTFSEFEAQAAFDEAEGVLELGLPRSSFTSLRSGLAGAAALLPAPGGPAGGKVLVDAIPDAPAPTGGTFGALAPFFDYTLNPPVVFTALGVSNAGAVEGETVQVFAELTNLGPKAVEGLSAQVLMDGAVAGTRGGLSLLPQGTAVIQFEWTATLGTHNVTAILLPGSATSSLPLVVRAGASNLRILEASASPSSPLVGAAFTVEVRIFNPGSQASTPALVLVKDGTQVITSATTASIAPNSTVVLQLEARLARAGDVPLRVEIDGQTSSNSSRELQVNVQPVDSTFTLFGPMLLVGGVAACGAAAWVLAPRLHRRRVRDPSPPEAPPPLP